LIKIFIILFLLLIFNNSFGQSDTSGSRDTNRIIIDGVVTINPIDDSSKSVVQNNLLEEIEVLTGGFGAEYGTIYCRLPFTPKKDSVKENIHTLRRMNHNQELYIVDGLAIPYSWYITHSIGFSPEESEPVFYVAVSKKITNSLYLGLKGGVYTFEADLDRAVNDTIQSHAPYPSPGTFTLTTDYITQGPSYIGAIYSTYELSKSFSVNGSAGIRFYSEKRWDGEVSFSIPSSNYTPPEFTVTPNMNLRILNRESIIKPYFSLGANYRTGKFEIGVFADNILSFGINLGMGFN